MKPHLTRREAIKASAAAGLATLCPAFGQNAGLKPPVRIPLHEFANDPVLVAALRKGVADMKRRLPSDPLSWFYQAAIHGVTKAAVECALKADPEVANVDQARYWNQCPHGREQNSADFLPWHRAYTYYFERILRHHTGIPDFALPYWDYSSKEHRKFPEIFGRQHLNKNIKDNTPDNINPLFSAQRDMYLTFYEHDFAKDLPYLELSDSAVDSSAAMATPVFFGETEVDGLGGWIGDNDPTTRGLLETSPHDPIHRVVGGIIPESFDGEGNPAGMTLGAMATPPTAGFDPIFCVHHSNIDRLWAEWSLMPGKSWGLKLPPRSWFDERKWYFFDIETTSGFAKPVERNEPRKAYFDYRALGIRFQSEDLTKTPLTLPADIPEAPSVAPKRTTLLASLDDHQLVTPLFLEAVSLPAIQALGIHASFKRFAAAPPAQGPKAPRFLVKLKNVHLGFTRAVGFDVHLTGPDTQDLSRQSPSFLGSVTLFNHDHASHGQGAHDHAAHGEEKEEGSAGVDQTFDATKAAAVLGGLDTSSMQIVIVPYSLVSKVGGEELFDPTPLRFSGVEFLSAE